jgi:hypothetical protein
VRFQEDLKVLKVLKLEGFNLKVKLKLKYLKGVLESGISEGGIPEGGVLEDRVVFDRFPKVRDRRFRTEGCSGGSQRVFGLAKERLNKGCFGGSQGSGVCNLAKK